MRRRPTAATLTALLAVACARAVGPSSVGQGGTDSEMPTTGRVICEADGPRLLTPVVRPQPDGVHFVVENRTEKELFFLVLHGLVEQDVAPGETRELVGPVGPGVARAGCYPTNEAQPTSDQLTDVEVQDPQGLWRSPELTCHGGGTEIRHIFGGASLAGSPEGVAETVLRGLRHGDVVRRAEYPEQELPVVSVIRDGRTIAFVNLLPVKEEWAVEGGTWCVTEQVRLG